jgi:hypothetical protein
MSVKKHKIAKLNEEQYNAYIASLREFTPDPSKAKSTPLKDKVSPMKETKPIR